MNASPSPLNQLQGDSTSEEVQAALKAWAEQVKDLDRLERALARDDAIAKLKDIGKLSPARLVDAALPHVQSKDEAQGQGQTLDMGDPERWSKAINGAELLDEIEATIRRFIVAEEQIPELVALWIVFTHAVQAFSIAPYLAISSPEKRCGKTTLLRLVGVLVRKPLPATSLTPAALFRAIDAWSPTLLLDEADSIFKDNEELRTILNAGVSRREAFAVRVVGDQYEPRKFSTFGPKAISLIGKLPDTLADRSIPAFMRRKLPSEKVERLPERTLQNLSYLQRKAWTWAQDNIEELRQAEPEMPRLNSDRALDITEPLIAIADAAGGEWPDKARQAVVDIFNRDDEEPEQASLRLLANLRTVFDEANKPEFLATDFIVRQLCAKSEWPWSTWFRGNRITARRVGKFLDAYKVKSTQRQDGGVRARGYRLKELQDSFARYLPDGEGGFNPCTRASARNHSGNKQNQSVHQTASARFENKDFFNDSNGVHTCTDTKGVGGELQGIEAEPDNATGQGGLL